MKKTFTSILALLATSGLMADNIYGFAGSGTEADPFQIRSAADFTTLAQKVTADHTAAGEYFKLMNDVDFAGTEASPAQLPAIAKAGITNITTVAWGFSGTFDGDGKAIRGLYHTNCANDADGKFNALFSSLGEGGIVRNLVISADNYIRSYNYAAPVVCVNQGGLVEHCQNDAPVIAVNAFAAGICSYIVGGRGTVDHCINRGDVSAASYAAGIVAGSQSGKAIGDVDAAYASVVVTGCQNYGNISTTNGTGSAGIAGSFSGAVTYCTNHGTVSDAEGTAKTLQYTAGIVSAMTYAAEVCGNVNKGAIAGGNYVGGIIGCLMKGGDEPVCLNDNQNLGTITATGDAQGDILGGTKRTTDVTITSLLQALPAPVKPALWFNILGQPVRASHANGILFSKDHIICR